MQGGGTSLVLGPRNHTPTQTAAMEQYVFIDAQCIVAVIHVCRLCILHIPDQRSDEPTVHSEHEPVLVALSHAFTLTLAYIYVKIYASMHRDVEIISLKGKHSISPASAVL